MGDLSFSACKMEMKQQGTAEVSVAKWSEASPSTLWHFLSVKWWILKIVSNQLNVLRTPCEVLESEALLLSMKNEKMKGLRFLLSWGMLFYLSTGVKQTWKQYRLKQWRSAYTAREIHSSVLQRISNRLSTLSKVNRNKVGIVLCDKKYWIKERQPEAERTGLSQPDQQPKLFMDL